MYWHTWWALSLLILGLSFLNAFGKVLFRYKRQRLITPNRALVLGTWGAATVLFFPLYLRKLDGGLSAAECVKAGLVSIQHSIRLFAFDGDYMDIVDMVEGLSSEIQTMYTLLGAILYLVAPILTVGLILSFFKNLTSYVHYIFSFWKETHVFSELNEKSLALAKSIDDANNKRGDDEEKRYKIFRKSLIVFTDVVERNDEDNTELLEEANEIGAILFTKDLESIKYRNRYLSFRKVKFYLISDDEEEKIRHAESIMRHYDTSGNIELRLFSDDIRSELLLAAKDIKKMKVTRVNDIQSLIYHNLDVHGLRLFENARTVDGSEKVISAVIVGLGKYGLETMKALTWFCQLPNYKIKINAFDIDEYARDKFVSMCPELMDDKYNKTAIPGEAHYDIEIHGGMDTNSPEFTKAFSAIKDATYIFVCLGNDELNLNTAIKIRTLCEKIQYDGDQHKPDIETVIYDSNVRNLMGVKWGDECKELKNDCKLKGWKLDNECIRLRKYNNGAFNFKSQHYNLHMIGDLEHFYCVNTLIDSKLIEEGKMVHLRWCPESTFWKYEYNYRSSIAKAMHERLRVKMNLDIPGLAKKWEERTEEEKLAIGQIEHVRWNAYMRTEGYQYDALRNDLGKIHHNLVPVSELKDEDLKKDA